MGLLAHLITWGALDLEIPLDTMVVIYSYVFVLSAVFGRLFGGFISDWYMARFGISRKPIIYFNILGVGLGVFLCPLVGSTLFNVRCMPDLCKAAGEEENGKHRLEPATHGCTMVHPCRKLQPSLDLKI